MSYNHFTTKERECLLVGLTKNLSIRQIAKELGRNPSSVSRELKRNCINGRYSPSTAQKSYELRRKACRRHKLIEDQSLKACIRSLILYQQWTPEQISRYLKRETNENISYNTIYRDIHRGFLEPYYYRKPKKCRYPMEKALRRKGKPVKEKVEKRGQIKISNPIEDLPIESKERLEIGHWEIDCLAGKQSESCLVVMIERKTRFVILEKAAKQRTKEVTHAMFKMMRRIPKQYLKTVICDRGKEFTDHEKMTKYFKIEFYFAHPSSPWEKPSVENINGFLREYFPKRKTIEHITTDYIRMVENRLNFRPRKVLNNETPFKLFV